MFRTAATKIAHNSTIPALGGNQPLQDLITAEKALLLSLQKLSVDFSKASETLRTWGLSEGDDLGDILGASAAVLDHFSAALSQYAARGQGMREQLKVIRAKDENLDEMKRRRRTAYRKADDAERKLSKMNPESKSLQMQTDLLNRLRDEVRSLDTDILVQEAALGDFKRSATKTFMGLKFGGLLECCQKGSIAGTFGKMLISDISEEQTQPGLHRAFYQSHQKTEKLVTEALRAVGDVTLTTVPTLDFPERRTYHIEREPPFVPLVQDEKPVPAVPKDSSDYPEFTPPPPTFANNVQPPPKTFSQRQILNPWSETQVVEPSVPPSTRERSSVDDFGMNLVRSSTGPIDLSNAPGGRFATFPVKARTAASPPPPPPASLPTFTLDPLPLQTSHDLGPSFASSIIDAFELEHSHPGPGNTGPDTRSKLLRLPSTSIKPSVSNNPWAGTKEETSRSHMRSSNLSDNDEALLAYLMSGDDDGGDSTVQHVSEKDSSSDQGVGEERQGESPKPESKSDQRISVLEDKRLSGSPSLGSPLAAGTTEERDHVYEGRSSLESSTSNLETASLSSSQLSSEEREKALNAAAAREITLELEALNGSWSSLHSDTVERGRTQAGTEQPYSSSGSGRDPSPLVPPSAPFARRAVSPHPAHEQDLVIPPRMGHPQHPTPPLMQPQAHQYSSLSQGLSPSQAYHTYRAQPPNSPLSGTPITERPSPSMSNPSGAAGPGTRTISAAAFKKPRRVSMDSLQGLPNLKGLPGSPYPVGTPRMFSASSVPSSSSYTPPSEQLEKPLPQFGHPSHYFDPYKHPSSTSEADPEFIDRSLRADGYQTGNFSTDLEEGALR